MLYWNGAVKNNIRELIEVHLENEKPDVREYDSDNPQQFESDVMNITTWQFGEVARLFQERLNLVADGTNRMPNGDIRRNDSFAIAAGIHAKLIDFGVEGDDLIPADTIGDYMLGGHNPTRITPWNKKNLYLVCMALGITVGARGVFGLYGVEYGRFADPIDITWCWVVEKGRSYPRLQALLAEVENIFADMKAEHGVSDVGELLPKIDKNKSELRKEIVALINSDFVRERREGLAKSKEIENTVKLTGSIKREIKEIWSSNIDEALILKIKQYKDYFHKISYTRAIIIEELWIYSPSLEEQKDARYLSQSDENRTVDRNDIIDLACLCGRSIEQINSILDLAGFAKIVQNSPDSIRLRLVEYAKDHGGKLHMEITGEAR